jgi:hypothetical protein
LGLRPEFQKVSWVLKIVLEAVLKKRQFSLSRRLEEKVLYNPVDNILWRLYHIGCGNRSHLALMKEPRPFHW